MNQKLKILSIWLNTHGFTEEANNSIFKNAGNCNPPFDKNILNDIKNNNITLEIKSRGPMVGALQELLENSGYTLNEFGVDCIFGPETKGKLKSFQRDANLETHGVLDSKTFSALEFEPIWSALLGDSSGLVDQHVSDEDFPKWSRLGEFKRRSSNFHKIDDGKNNYRSAKPPQDPRFFKYIKEKYNIQRVINLAGEITGEEGPVREAGLEYLHMPIRRRPKEEDWNRIKDFLERGNTLVHCMHGADRTGAVVANWKLERDASLTEKEAYDEALGFGFKPKEYQRRDDKKDPNKRLRNWIGLD